MESFLNIPIKVSESLLARNAERLKLLFLPLNNDRNTASL